MLKKPAKEVIIPFLGMENAKFVSPSRLTVPLAAEIPEKLVPNATALEVLSNPPSTVVKVTGVPEAYGIIAPLPAKPIGPVGPVAPVTPIGPVGPVGPVTPIGPVGPVGAYIIGKQTTCKKAVPLNRVLMGIDLDVFSYSAVLISEF
ncbi:hypothetical protein BN3590_01075 [Clostridium sp. C105KSO15]|nr:hypothetical protein BN3590_01075 [Clostridium sp. C105KSO15]